MAHFDLEMSFVLMRPSEDTTDILLQKWAGNFQTDGRDESESGLGNLMVG